MVEVCYNFPQTCLSNTTFFEFPNSFWFSRLSLRNSYILLGNVRSLILWFTQFLKQTFQSLWLNFPNFFTYSEETFEFCCNFMYLFPNHKKFCIYLLCLKLISTYRVFIFYSCNFHMRYVARIFLNLIQVCKLFVLKLWAIEIVFLQARGNHLKKVFLGKHLNHHWSLRELFLLNLSENGTFV